MKNDKCRGCKNCRHISYEFGEGSNCNKAPVIKIDPLKGITRKKVRCVDRNKRLNCPWFEEKDTIKRHTPGKEVIVRLVTWLGNIIRAEATIVAVRDNYCMINISEKAIYDFNGGWYSRKIEGYLPFTDVMVWVPVEDIEGFIDKNSKC